jgi:hypothetical protein
MAYQIIVFEPNPQGRADALWATLQQRFRDLDIDLETEVRLLRDPEDGLADQKSPAAAVYFGGEQTATTAVCRSLASLLERSITVLPVVDDLRRYLELVPQELAHINGFEFDAASPNYEAISAHTLEALSLLRDTRRLFISYRRSDSRKVAIQLYEALDEKTFDVFLDTVSIRPGEEFQKVLAHRMADVDVIVLLHTREFIGSRWTIAELTQANAMNIAILRLEWPEIRDIRNSTDPAEQERAARLDEEAALSVPLVLEPGDFDEEGRLTATVIKRVLDSVEALRARALAARQAKLTREFAQQARERLFSVYPQPEQYLLLQKQGATDLIVYPVVGAPSAIIYERIHDAVIAARRAKASEGDTESTGQPEELFILYDDRALLERHLKHVSWLDEHISAVRSIAVADAARILAEKR